MRKLHMDQIERWAEFVRKNPEKWRYVHTKFINSIFSNQKRVYNELSKTTGGKKKLIELYSIKKS